MRKGYIHSQETFGTLDGPGIRYVLFMQGCPLRCAYCHNPDTWKLSGGKEVTAEEILKQYQKNRPFYEKGGFTVTGGEPLLQVDFLLELFQKAKELEIHTCIDTSGITYQRKDSEYAGKLDQLMKVTDLVLLDIKHIDPKKHKELTGQENQKVLDFARYLDKKGIPLWIRHVYVPGYSDTWEELQALGRFIGTLSNVKALEVLPYHTMGIPKYRKLQIAYPLEGIPAAGKEEAHWAREVILSGIRESRGIKR